MTDDINTLHAAALVVATKMLAQLSDDDRRRLELGAKSGAKLLLQLGQLPDCTRVELIQVEREGLRSMVCAVGAP
jgi:hypothetical protein